MNLPETEVPFDGVSINGAREDSTYANYSVPLPVGALLAAYRAVRRPRSWWRWVLVGVLGGIAALGRAELLLLVPLVPGIGTSVGGARIWVNLGAFTFQPGEFAKLALALFFAGYLVVKRDSLALVRTKFLGMGLPRLKDLGPILIAWAISLAVLVFETDLGTSLLFFGLFVVMLYVATGRRSWVFIGSVFAMKASSDLKPGAVTNRLQGLGARVDMGIGLVDGRDVGVGDHQHGRRGGQRGAGGGGRHRALPLRQRCGDAGGVDQRPPARSRAPRFSYPRHPGRHAGRRREPGSVHQRGHPRRCWRHARRTAP